MRPALSGRACKFSRRRSRNAGIDRKAIRDYIASHEFSNAARPISYKDGDARTRQRLRLGQWQNGNFEIIWPAANATKSPLYPKPEWK